MDWVQLAIFLIAMILLVKPLGIYIFQVLDPAEKTFLDPVFKPLEKWLYRDRTHGERGEKGQTIPKR